MRCPICKKEFHPQPKETHTYALRGNQACEFLLQKCPSCGDVIVMRKVGAYALSPQKGVTVQGGTTEIVYPVTDDEKELVSLEVPDEYRNDFYEAATALEYSPKASAALSRRLLQKLLREKLEIKKRDLSQEIDEFIANVHAPSYLTDAIDAIRHIGNFAAHPIKYENSGEIVEVEAGEADWLLEVLKSLFDFIFVQPAKLEQRRQALNAKLKNLGKPQLKGR
ncbi:protein of unknown function [Thiothrix eikelboomii]|uniref:DUF4145 domain-containing protein n=1 Tax=Thiothrix eikelboomii TaxID=92487 RepID=A0A1T4Y0T8_9GAMM|nr:DUF4145 domain-containing protein [Thiothrix eikelboomii]SKA95390.1 protein of unknown function [Thiothrix eikelboomii]